MTRKFRNSGAKQCSGNDTNFTNDAVDTILPRVAISLTHGGRWSRIPTHTAGTRRSRFEGVPRGNNVTGVGQDAVTHAAGTTAAAAAMATVGAWATMATALAGAVGHTAAPATATTLTLAANATIATITSCTTDKVRGFNGQR